MVSHPCTADEAKPPSEGQLARFENGKLIVPDNLIVAYFKGDGIGPEIVESAKKVLDAAVDKAYGGTRRIVWWEVAAGEEAQKECGSLLPDGTLQAFKLARVNLKGPLTTPVGGGFRSLNVTLRMVLDLYSNVRPVKWYGQPTPHCHPEKIDWVIFRENTEDVYAGIEWSFDSPEAQKLRDFLKKEFGIELTPDTGIGIKPISKWRTQRHVRRAMEWAIRNGYKHVTIMHKGNIMKYTEGAFRQWAYDLILSEFRDYVVTEDEVNTKYGGKAPEGKIIVNDRIADNMLQQIITRPGDYNVIVTPNLNGDYISDEANALVGGIGMAAGLDMGDGVAVAEPVHGSAPKYAGKNVINPTAEILSGMYLLSDFVGWPEVRLLVEYAVRQAIAHKQVTYDLAREMGGITPISTTEYTDVLIDYIRHADLKALKGQ
ncbi:Isocitrate dehydrogenase (NADP+-dependent) [Acidilobus saccharovorans 345-15]|uniref:isocitrate dehydrogenase (NADP(+)) n=1 Tax=Acidilobus saccharovorans (strain DSM 16705 / JCM 18335 / VKM B-2471 / 345-15) TaxID=666510 RepID=D9Q1N5_ACIS3|nr:NADP-dependent isocitrate dehydrogenase [Acidilobus saccharovorans]ADL19223.1 Isocitrate dehydrogenase (NADP+-dependent) [Acidilobus saccharovorans 345-15]